MPLIRFNYAVAPQYGGRKGADRHMYGEVGRKKDELIRGRGVYRN